jgi:hypothetical protein
MDCFFADRASTVLDPSGNAYPSVWVQDDKLKKEFTDYPRAPPVIGTLIDGRKVYFELCDGVNPIYKEEGVFLASSYAMLQTVYPDVAKQCMEAEYILNGNQGRCKYTEVPKAATVLEIYAPVKYSGVESPTEPKQPDTDRVFPTRVKEVSQVDLGLIAMKNKIKPVAMEWIKSNPKCEDTELIEWLGKEFGRAFAGIVTAMLEIYITGASDEGLIPERSFAAFRDFVVNTPKEALEAF